MGSRRNFLKGSLVLAGAVAAGRVAEAQTGTALPPALVYTKNAPGRWAGKEGLHVPKVAVEGGKVTIVTPHPMTAQHFIVKHTLITPEGKLVGEKTFASTDAKAESAYDLPADFRGTLWATSFCNLHDLWLTEVTV
jgi:superoxide reductase